jgi:stearoyl-CoA desaturase (delta-9 desaturase)
MMMNTLKVYLGLFSGRTHGDASIDPHYPEWKAFDRWADGLAPRVLFGVLYVWFYVAFATAPWQYVFLPLHFVMGPVHGAIVNWCGHRYGYANYDNRDESKNTFAVDLLTMGELMQNNHHRHGKNPNFAVKLSEWDPTYAIIRLFVRMKIVRL